MYWLLNENAENLNFEIWTVFLNWFDTFLQTQVTVFKTVNTVIWTLYNGPEQIVHFH